MIFGSKKNKEINISIDNVQIERVHTFNFLGIMLDESLTWTDHTNMVANNISSITGVLYRLKSVFFIKRNIANIIIYLYWVIHKL